MSITRHLLALRQGNASVLTIKAYRWQLDRLAAWLAGRGVTDPAEIDEDLLIEWGASLYEIWSPSSVKQAVTAARGWLRYCYAKHLILDASLPGVLETPDVKKRIQRTLWPDEIGALWAACDLSSKKGLREAAIVSVLIDSGLRAAELCRLQLRDVDIDAGKLKVIIKGGDEEWGFFGGDTAARLRAWLDARPAKPGVDRVFTALGGTRFDEDLGRNVSSYGHGLTTHGLRRLLRRLGDEAGVENVSPHAFRRAFVVLLTEAGADDELIAEWGRWKDERMVKLYRLAYTSGKRYNEFTPTAFLERRRQARQAEVEH